MSNPLIRPNDPRFQRPSLTDETGANRFADDTPPPAEFADVQPGAGSPYSTPQPSAEPAYQPEYVSGQPSRQSLIFSLTGSSVAALGGAAIAIWMAHWVTYPLLLIALPTAAVGWYTAADELSVIRKGGVGLQHRPAARFGLALGIVCTLLALALAYAAIESGIGMND